MTKYDVVAGQVWTITTLNGGNIPIMVLAVTYDKITTINIRSWDPQGQFAELEELIVPSNIDLNMPSVTDISAIFSNRIYKLVDYIGTVNWDYYSDVIHAISDYYMGKLILDKNKNRFTYPSRSRRYIYDDFINRRNKPISSDDNLEIIHEAQEDIILDDESEDTIQEEDIYDDDISEEFENETDDSISDISTIVKAVNKHFKEDGYSILTLDNVRPRIEYNPSPNPKPRKDAKPRAGVSGIYDEQFTEDMVMDILTLPIANIEAKYSISFNQIRHLRLLIRTALGLENKNLGIMFPDNKNGTEVTVNDLAELNPDIPRARLSRALYARHNNKDNIDISYSDRDPKFTWSFNFTREELKEPINMKDSSLNGLIAQMDEFMYDLKDLIEDKITSIEFSDLALNEHDLAIKYGIDPDTDLAKKFYTMASRAFYKTNVVSLINITNEMYIEFANVENRDKLLQFCKDTLAHPRSVYAVSRQVYAKQSADRIQPKDLSHISKLIDLIREMEEDAVIYFEYIPKSKFMKIYNISEDIYSKVVQLMDTVPVKNRMSMIRMIQTFTDVEMHYMYEIRDVFYASYTIDLYANKYDITIQVAYRTINLLIENIYAALLVGNNTPDEIVEGIDICKTKEYEFREIEGKRSSRNTIKLLAKLDTI